MVNAMKKLEQADWSSVQSHVNERGFALVKSVLTEDDCRTLRGLYETSGVFRKTVNMERYRFGKGEYKYFSYPLHDTISEIRKTVYSHLVPLANEWMENLGSDTRYPPHHEVFIRQCHLHGQDKATVLILKYGTGGFNTLHQDLYGSIYFPFQIVLFLDEHGRDYEGGEFVLTEQIPRAQSKAMVVTPGLGDMLIFTTNFRPVKGSRGYYRVTVKHGVSAVHNGQRHTLGIIFHDATS